jgi:hypothetical protein
VVVCVPTPPTPPPEVRVLLSVVEGSGVGLYTAA